ncbi:MAG: hypothetical protein KAX52_00125, partial [Pseudomonas sp.]|nr:hypothetical protein [Pseudomonas sp.]
MALWFFLALVQCFICQPGGGRGCLAFMGRVFLILPTNDGHPVKRVNYATEVNHDKTIRKEKNIPEAAFAGIQEG